MTLRSDTRDDPHATAVALAHVIVDGQEPGLAEEVEEPASVKTWEQLSQRSQRIPLGKPGL
tara:strand:- start:823 stop:1005 length:183 start_codon:yes stop_codon:yes gene_type:complete